MSAEIPSDEEMLQAIRRAKFRLIQDIAMGKAGKMVQLPGGVMVQAQDSDRLLNQLAKMESLYRGRTVPRGPIELGPAQ